MTLEVTITKLNAMKLHTFAQSMQERLTRSDHQDLSFEEMLGLIVDDEWMARENRKLTRRLKQAKFKVQASLEEIDYQIKRGLQKTKILELAQLRFIEHHQDIVIVGSTGIGKSFLAQALGQRACMKGYSVHYIRTTKLLDQFHLAHADGSFVHLLARFSKYDLLIIDDWGIGVLGAEERKDLLDLIEERSEIRSTVITTQLPTNNWHEFIGDETIGDAICDRIIHRAYRIDLSGESVRKLKSKSKANDGE